MYARFQLDGAHAASRFLAGAGAEASVGARQVMMSAHDHSLDLMRASGRHLAITRTVPPCAGMCRHVQALAAESYAAWRSAPYLTLP